MQKQQMKIKGGMTLNTDISKAATLIGELTDSIKDENQELATSDLSLFVIQLIFCYFAENTGIFQDRQFSKYLHRYNRTEQESLQTYMKKLFLQLKPSQNKTQSDIGTFSSISTGLFDDIDNIPKLSKDHLRQLHKGTTLDWSGINPIFIGTIYQELLEGDIRADRGIYFTSISNIMKLIRPLFFNRLQKQYEKHSTNVSKLQELLNEIQSFNILDPACGTGNFLVIAYQELKELEYQVLDQLEKLRKQNGTSELPLQHRSGVDLSQLYGIEIDRTTAAIARTILLITASSFQDHPPIDTITDNPTIICKNALQFDWEDLVSMDKIDVILGNPPFLGNSLLSEEQQNDMEQVCRGKISNFKSLDYVTGWFIKTAEYISNQDSRAAFVSTNSITQGQQPAILWDYLLSKGISIDFAYRQFQWVADERAGATVFVVIIGFSTNNIKPKILYDTSKESIQLLECENISPYLTTGETILIQREYSPISPDIAKMKYGGKPVEGGYLFYNQEEKDKLLQRYPNLSKYIRPLWGAREVISGKHRYCLWLEDTSHKERENEPGLTEILDNVTDYRLASKKKATREAALTPHLFAEPRQPKGHFIAIPRHTSANRDYIPFRFLSPDNIITDALSFIDEATYYEFGILSSHMHMIWVEITAGRLGEGYRYGGTTVYNTFPFPVDPQEKARKELEECVEEILQIRNDYHTKSLAELYSSQKMPRELKRCHLVLDQAVERCYRKEPFHNDRERLEYMLKLYQNRKNDQHSMG